MERNIWKEAVLKDLRIKTATGLLNLYEISRLKTENLAKVVRSLNVEIKVQNPDSDLDFLEEVKKVDGDLLLSFDIVKEIYNDKKAAEKAISEKKALDAEREENNQKVLRALEIVQSRNLLNLSEDELKAKLK